MRAKPNFDSGGSQFLSFKICIFNLIKKCKEKFENQWGECPLPLPTLIFVYRDIDKNKFLYIYIYI
jgi:hypothetical protein